jgi:hypothetical protein
MIEADILFKLLPTSILDIYNVFEHIEMLSIGICHYIRVEAVILFKLLPASILDIYKVFEHIDMLSIGIK